MEKVYLHQYLDLENPPMLYTLEHNGRRYLYIHGYNHLIQAKCPHAGADLGEADIVQDRIVCPKHHYKFDLSSGRCLTDDCYRLRTYPLSEDEKGIYFSA